MNNINIIKKARVEVPESEQFDGIVAFQLCDFHTNFFGKEMISTLDTKIMAGGRQYVIDDDGFIPSHFELI